jgi:hypothetical protein
VSVDQHLFALNGKTGALLWKRALPRQRLHRYDSAWTVIFRVGKQLLVCVYEDLFKLEAASGKLIWAYDCGPFCNAWPKRKGDYLFVEQRHARQASMSITAGAPRKRISAVQVARAGRGACDYGLRFMSRRDIPRSRTAWWSLRRPSVAKKTRVRLVLAVGEKSKHDPHHPLRYDLSRELAKHTRAYVRLFTFRPLTTLYCNGKAVASGRAPRH